MSGLSELSGGVRSDVLNGYTLSQWTIRDYGECEAEFERAFINTVDKSSLQTSPNTRDAMMSHATEYIGKGNLKYGSQDFDLQCFQPRWVPLLAWLSLRERHPKVTREEARTLITHENRNEVHAAVLEMLGLINPKKSGEPGEAQAGGSTGPESSLSSAGNENSATTKSAA